MRRVLTLALAVCGAALPAAAFAQSASTIRVETRPFYGATVTLEEGVRVFRPLPPHGKVIVNPGGKTPLNLGLEEHHSVSHNTVTHEGGAGAQPVLGGGGGVIGTTGHGRHHGHHGPSVGSKAAQPVIVGPGHRLH